MSVKKDETNLQEEKKQFSRRDFMKATGVTAGAVGIASVASTSPALAGEKSTSAITNFAVKEVDRPPYMDYPFEFDDNKFKRMDSAQIAFQNQDLFDQEFDGQPWYIPYSQKRAQKVIDNVPGWTLMDQSMAAAAETSSTICGNTLFSWESIGATDVGLAEKVGKIYTNPEDNNRYIKKAASIFGAGDTGVTELNEKWFYSKDHGVPIIFSDEYDVPTVTEEAKYIPKKMNRVIAMTIPLEGEIAKYTPSRLGSVTDNLGYSKMPETAGKLAEFIRGLGYNAIAFGNDNALSIPFALDAGLGELGRNGLLISPKFGVLCKVCKVATDMPLALDKPINFGAAEFCRSCMKCADNCPSDSIPREKDPTYDVQCPSNNPGVKKWFVNTWTCLKFWTENGGGCMMCQTSCPYSKPQTWIHDVVKGISSRTTLFNSTFRVLDDTLGYGTTLEDNDPTEWWEQEGLLKEWQNLK